MSLWAGILAAGEGRRLGRRPKALLRLGDATFLEQIVLSARRGGAEAVAVVTGHHRAQVEPLARALCDRVAWNPDPDRGMGSSARALALVLPDDAALLLWPVDHPLVSEQTIEALRAAAERCPGRLILPVAPGGEGTSGHPPLLPPALVRALRELPDEARLDHFLEARGGEPVLVETSDRGIFRDVDLPADLAELREGAEGADQLNKPK